MTQTTEPSRLLTDDEAKSWTARLVDECPQWCTVAHDLDAHPEDIRHSRVVGMTVIGEVSVYAYPVELGGVPQTGIWVDVAARDDSDLRYDDAMNAASVMIRAAVALKGLTP